MEDSVHITPDGGIVYVIVEDRGRFDSLNLPLTDHGDKGNRGHVLSKSIEQGIYIVFQHWVRSPSILAAERQTEG